MTQQVEKLSETNKSLAQKIKKLLSDLLAKVKEIYSRLSADSEESKIVSQMSDTLSDIMDKWSQGIINASKNADTVTGKSQTKNTANNDGVRYMLRNVPDDFSTNIQEVSQMSSVIDLSGDEFSKSEIDLVTQVEEFFRSIGDSVTTNYGDILLTRPGIKSSVAHGLGRAKAVAFKAVPTVLKQSKIINYQKNWKNRGYDTAVFAAPITISDTGYYMAVVVRAKSDSNDYYLHEVALQEKEDTAVFKTGTANSGTPSTDASSVYSLLQKLKNSNTKSKKFDRDTAYLDAVESGDMKTAQRMVDEAAKKAGYTTKTYHGTESFGFTKFDLSKRFKTKAVFMTDNVEVASTYSGIGGTRKISEAFKDSLDGMSTAELVKELNKKEYITGNTKYYKYYKFNDELIVKDLYDGVLLTLINIEQAKQDLIRKKSVGNYTLYVKLGNSLVVDCKGAECDEVVRWNKESPQLIGTTDEVAKHAKEQGYDSVILKNLIDNGGRKDIGMGKTSTVYIVFDPLRIKSADPVTYDDNGNVIPLSQRFNEDEQDIRYSQREVLENIEDSFSISKVNDYVHVQKQVISTLALEGFFDNNVVTVEDNGMVVEVNKSGIKETLGSGMKFERLPRFYKKLKLATIRDLPKFISTAKVLEDDAANIHNSESVLKWAYLSNKLRVDDTEYDITIAIRKSPQKNKFWIHEVRIKEKEQSLNSSSDNLKQESMEFSVHNDNVSQNDIEVKGFDGETKYQPRPSIDDFLFDDEYSELTDNDAYLIGQYITGDALTVNHLINNTRKTELSDSALNHIVSKLVKSYNLDTSYNKDVSIALLSYIFYIY